MIFDQEDRESIRVCGFWYWLFCRTGLYQRVMRLAHRHDWHHAPIIGPLAPNGGYHRWCQWCGFRQGYAADPRVWPQRWID